MSSQLGTYVNPLDQLRRYDSEVPRNLVDLLDRTVAHRPNDRAFIDDHTVVTWSEFARITTVTARAIASKGVGPGDRVAVLAGNGIPLTTAYWAIWQLGAIAVPLNHRLLANDLAVQLGDCTPGLLLVGRGKDGLGRAASLESSTPTVFQGDDDYFFSGSEGVDFATPPLDEFSPAAIMYTSGTTGRAKGVVISHGNAIQNSVTCTAVTGRRSDDIELIMVPQFNVTGLCSQTIPAVHLGMTAVLLNGFNAESVVDLVREHAVTSTVGAPTMWWRILESAGDTQLTSLRLALYGGAPMPTALLDRMNSVLTSASFGNGYGMTETCSMVTYLGGEDALSHAESVGQPLPVTDLRIVDPESNQDVESGSVGEVIVKGPQVAIGYWIEGTVAPLVDRDGWYHTGDAARLIDGFIVLADRLKEVIKRGGESIFSIEIEEILYQHPAVLEAAVVGVPDHMWGEKVLAAVVCKPGAYTDEGDIQNFCRKSLASFKVPSFVEFVDELPRNAGGKVVKGILKGRFTRSEVAEADG